MLYYISETHRQLSVLPEEEYPNTVCTGEYSLQLLLLLLLIVYTFLNK